MPLGLAPLGLLGREAVGVGADVEPELALLVRREVGEGELRAADLVVASEDVPVEEREADLLMDGVVDGEVEALVEARVRAAGLDRGRVALRVADVDLGESVCGAGGLGSDEFGWNA